MRVFFLALLVSLALVGCRTSEPPAEPDRVTVSIAEGHEGFVRLVAYQDGADAWRELDAVDGGYSFEVTDEAGPSCATTTGVQASMPGGTWSPSCSTPLPTSSMT